MSALETSAPTVTFQEKAANAVDRFRNNRFVKPSLVLVAVGVGAFLGARQPMASISRDVHTMADRTKRIDHNLFTFANHTMVHNNGELEFRVNQREAIEDYVDNGTSFTHYPGVGVRNDNAKSKKS